MVASRSSCAAWLGPSTPGEGLLAAIMEREREAGALGRQRVVLRALVSNRCPRVLPVRATSGTVTRSGAPGARAFPSVS
ncbi:hypothetical protein [Prauserella endophytica]|uniref:hypothetical protein n=1 Tax=Prauserella endophytica TaxID=1592324 RepID=UPI00130511CB|nr:hypothetical protein [Prauserella endophytica]